MIFELCVEDVKINQEKKGRKDQKFERNMPLVKSQKEGIV